MQSSVFKYDESETITQYLRRVEVYKIKLMNEKYIVVLNFLNELLELNNKFKLKSLRDFNRINETDLIKNKSHNIEVINKYKDEFDEKLNVTLNDNKINKDTKYIIFVIKTILSAVNFKLKTFNYSSGRQYSIKN